MTRPRGVPTRIWETAEREIIRQACIEHRGNLHAAVDVACERLPTRPRKGISQQVRERGFMAGPAARVSATRRDYYQEPPPLIDPAMVPDYCCQCNWPVVLSAWDNEIAACLGCGTVWHLSRPVERGRR